MNQQMKEEHERNNVTPLHAPEPSAPMEEPSEYANVDLNAVAEAGGFTVEKTESGYTLTLKVESEDAAKEAAVRFVRMTHFQTFLGKAFRDGMIDGIKAVRKHIAGAGSEIYRKPLTICDRVVAAIVAQPHP
jgi:hypothetical protein